MNHHSHRSEHFGPEEAATERQITSNFGLALSATIHCLIGCGVGEVAGVVIGNALSLAMTPSMILGIVLGFVFGFIFGMYPLIKAGFGFYTAVRQVLVAEGLSIAVMELFEALVQVYMPGVMQAGLGDSLFWIGMLASLAAGFIAAFPVNLVLVARGIRHQH